MIIPPLKSVFHIMLLNTNPNPDPKSWFLILWPLIWLKSISLNLGRLHLLRLPRVRWREDCGRLRPLRSLHSTAHGTAQLAWNLVQVGLRNSFVSILIQLKKFYSDNCACFRSLILVFWASFSTVISFLSILELISKLLRMFIHLRKTVINKLNIHYDILKQASYITSTIKL